MNSRGWLSSWLKTDLMIRKAQKHVASGIRRKTSLSVSFVARIAVREP